MCNIAATLDRVTFLRLVFVKLRMRLDLIRVTCYATPLCASHFKCALNALRDTRRKNGGGKHSIRKQPRPNPLLNLLTSIRGSGNQFNNKLKSAPYE